MSFSHSDIRSLRQRLGWSRAEMARRLGCTTDLLGQWENGAKVPESETLNQLRYLRNHADMTSIQTQRQPAIEVEIEIRRVSQLTHRDLFGG